MAELLADLVGSGVRCGIVTSKGREAAESNLESVGLAGQIKVLVAMEDTDRHKPSPDPLLRAVDQLGVAADDVCYVGDAAVDLRAAEAAGCAAIGVTWGAGLRSELIAERSVAVVDEVSQLRALLLSGASA